MSPQDIDFLTAEPEGVHRFAGLMAGYVAPRSEGTSPHNEVDWWSTEEHPISAGPDEHGFLWHFARWPVEGFRVEIAHIAAPDGFPTSKDGAGIWEAGAEIWPHIRHTPFAGYQVPVVPLEIQLQTNLARGLKERADGIIAIFQKEGYDRALVEQSLSHKNLETLERLVGGA